MSDLNCFIVKSFNFYFEREKMAGEINIVDATLQVEQEINVHMYGSQNTSNMLGSRSKKIKINLTKLYISHIFFWKRCYLHFIRIFVFIIFYTPILTSEYPEEQKLL